MAFDADEEILQDFLVEAGEILELLQEQLVDLEKSPDDKNLLNAIFRGFHTVKGGAGFLSLTALVEVCHRAENVFDMLRNGKLDVSPELMDVVLAALDTVNSMFDEVKQMREPTPADPDLLERLDQIAAGEAVHAQPVAPAPVAAPVLTIPPVADDAEDIADAEFEALLDQLHGSKTEAAPKSAAPPGSGDEISDDEFESLLDELHGKGQFKTVSDAKAKPAASSDEISDDEFESLLDELHGKGQFKAGDANKAVKPSSGGADTISEQEFEALLDQLHGKGKSVGGPAAAASAPPAPPKPAPQASAPVAPAKSAAEKPADKPAAAPLAPKPAAREAKDDDDKAAAAADTTVRVDTKRLDEIMNLVGELVLVRNRLLTLAVNYQDEELNKTIQNLDLTTATLQGAVMKTRMQPIKKVFGRFPRVVRDLARSLKKDILLELEGEDTDLDKNLVEALADPLVHLVRNSVDHGIEMPDVREAAGKSRTGRVLLSAAQEGDHILLSISDDGGGMDPEKLKARAVEKGLFDRDAAERMSESEAFNLIFAPGFSTKQEISDISGRGVGMDVVKTKITQLNGTVNIDSAKGVGTTIRIKVPLTLAILPTLMVTVGKQIFAFPLAAVNEIFHLDLTKTNVVDGQLMIIVRGKALPLFYLDRWLVRNFKGREQKTVGHVVLLQVGTQRLGFVVDGLLGQEEVVIKPLGTSLQGTPGMAGATITSDGGIALILDVPGLLKKYARREYSGR
ncbi:MAG: chemotaxis protein CheA [Gammaproteobacteria bacterium]|nr:chemotaxis protein CheA [Gammaproteobacteria bacterium]